MAPPEIAIDHTSSNESNSSGDEAPTQGWLHINFILHQVLLTLAPAPLRLQPWKKLHIKGDKTKASAIKVENSAVRVEHDGMK